jgi:hypothetical protein
MDKLRSSSTTCRKSSCVRKLIFMVMVNVPHKAAVTKMVYYRFLAKESEQFLGCCSSHLMMIGAGELSNWLGYC